jgi:hypothetical protein
MVEISHRCGIIYANIPGERGDRMSNKNHKMVIRILAGLLILGVVVTILLPTILGQ